MDTIGVGFGKPYLVAEARTVDLKSRHVNPVLTLGSDPCIDELDGRGKTVMDYHICTRSLNNFYGGRFW